MKKINKKKMQIGIYSTFIIVAAVIAVLLINIGAVALENKFGMSFDMTSEGMYKISSATREILKQIDEPVNIYYLETPTSMSERIRHFLLQYQVANSNITFEYIDPAQNPNFVKQFDTDGSGVAMGTVVVATGDHSKFKVLSINNDMTEYDSTYNITYFLGEEIVTKAIKHLTEEASYAAYFVTGHDEVSITSPSLTKLVKRLEQDNYIVGTINLLQDTDKLKNEDVLIMLGPKTDISESERETLKNFLDNLGRLFITMSPSEERLENLESLLEYYDLSVGKNIVYETQKAQYYELPNIPVAYGGTDTTSIAYDPTMRAAVAILPNVSTVGYEDKGKSGWTFNEVLRTSPYSFYKTDIYSSNVEKEQGDTSAGTNGFLTAVYAKFTAYEGAEVENTRILLIGSTDFISDSNYSSLRYNSNMFINGVHLLAGRNEDIGVDPLKMADTTVTFTNAQTVQTIVIVVVVVIPLLILTAGIIVWRKRRYL